MPHVDTYYYLATPYSKYPGGIDWAYRLACEQAAWLIKQGVPVFSPIAHSHGIADHGGINPFDHGVWLPADKPMMAAASALIVVKAPGWKESLGIAYEIKEFKSEGKPIWWMLPREPPSKW